MGMPAPEPVTTIEELLALPEDHMRHELLDGVHVVTPSPTWVHQRAVREFSEQLGQALRGQSAVEVLFSPADVRLGPKTLVQPDLFIVPRGDQEWENTPVPFLVVEVLSRATAARDRGAKRRLYLDAGVEEYWIVDLDARMVERWREGDRRPEVIEGTLEWRLRVGVSGTIELPALFDRVRGGQGGGR